MNARDDEPFTMYVSAHGTDLMGLAYLLVGNRGGAQDLVQAVLSRALLR